MKQFSPEGGEKPQRVVVEGEGIPKEQELSPEQERELRVEAEKVLREAEELNVETREVDWVKVTEVEELKFRRKFLKVLATLDALVAALLVGTGITRLADLPGGFESLPHSEVTPLLVIGGLAIAKLGGLLDEIVAINRRVRWHG